MADKVERTVSEYAWLRIKRAHVQRSLIGMRVGSPASNPRLEKPDSARRQPAAPWHGCRLAVASDAKVVPGFGMRAGMSVRAGRAHGHDGDGG